ncbi:MAG: ribonuclease activity regulator RraA [Chloroflexi bacterium]|nr:ribonuclease activity regulator RraA [Chloroflexota bacterium]
MTDLPLISDETLGKLREIPTPTLIDALWVMNWPQAQIHGARPLQPGQRMAGRAVTLRFVPHRPDIATDKPKGEQSAEYVAFELCGPGTVLVASAVGPWESIGGDIKFLRLAQRHVGGLVTDGSVRDTASLKEYGFPVYSFGTTAKQGPAVQQPWGVNEIVTCGGIAVRPGDAVCGDDDAVVVVPRSTVDDVIRIAHEREATEQVIKNELNKNPGSPGKYYPFNENTKRLVEEYRKRGEA